MTTTCVLFDCNATPAPDSIYCPAHRRDADAPPGEVAPRVATGATPPPGAEAVSQVHGIPGEVVATLTAEIERLREENRRLQGLLIKSAEGWMKALEKLGEM